jgi:hypothetical protein
VPSRCTKTSRSSGPEWATRIGWALLFMRAVL